MFKIFKPFESVNSKSDVFITSWNIAAPDEIKSVVKNINRAAKIRGVVGFSKQSHDCNELKAKVLEYAKMGWSIKVLPSFHAKIWCINSNSWIGSANFCPDTLQNYMIKCKITPRLLKFMTQIWQKAYNVNSSSKLWLLPQK
jgi:hypothetical protein